MRILVVSLMYPLPTNVARGTFVSDNVELFRSCGHEVKVVNPLPRMLKYQETRRSTLTGVAPPHRHLNTEMSKFLCQNSGVYQAIPTRQLRLEV